MPLGFCLFPHELPVISTPPCWRWPTLKSGLGARHTVIFKADKSGSEETGASASDTWPRLWDPQGGGGGRQRRHRRPPPTGAGARSRAADKPLTAREQGTCVVALEHTRCGPFVGCPGGVFSVAEACTLGPQCAQDGEELRREKSPVDRDRFKMRNNTFPFKQGVQLPRVNS